MGVLFFYGGMLLIGTILLWYTGFYAAKRAVLAIEERNLEGIEWLLAILPLYNTGLLRKAVRGSGKIMYIVSSVFYVVFVITSLIALFSQNPFVLLGAIILRYLVMGVTFGFITYIHISTMNDLSMGMLSIILGIIFPPYAGWKIGKDIVPIMNYRKHEIKERALKAQHAR